MAHHPPEEVQQRWLEIFENPLLSTETFKACGTLGATSSCLRSVFWRVWLARLPLPTHAETTPSSHRGPRFSPAWAHYVETTRDEWQQLKHKYLASPDSVAPSDHSRSPGQLQEVAAEADPLSLGEDSPWQDWYDGQQLRKTIMMDVKRTFPDSEFFRDPGIHEMMANILQVWSKLSDYGYRQGIHELLGCVLEAVYLDSIPPSAPATNTSSLETCRLILDERYIEADSYALFHRLMLQAGDFYDPTPSIAMPLSQSNSFKVEQPIVAQLHRIVNVLLANIDPAITSKLKSLEIEPQLFGLRWLRLLFTREFPLPEALELWDALFAEDTTLKLVDFIIIAMLLRIRTELLAGEYSEVLQLLLRYPQPEDGDYHIDALFHQAKLLRDNPTPSGAAIIKQQNKALGFGGGATPRESRSPVSSMRRSSAAHMRSESMQLPFGYSSTSPRAFQYPNASGAFTDLARNVYARAESTGINNFVRSFGQPPPGSSPPTQTDFRGQAVRHQQMRQTNELESLKRQHRDLRALNGDCAAALGVCSALLEQASTSTSAASIASVIPVLRHLQEALGKQEDQPARLDQHLLDNLRAQLPDHRQTASSSESESQAPDLHIDPLATPPTEVTPRFSRLDVQEEGGASSYPPLKGLRRRSLALSPPSKSPNLYSTSPRLHESQQSPRSPVLEDPLGALR